MIDYISKMNWGLCWSLSPFLLAGLWALIRSAKDIKNGSH